MKKLIYIRGVGAVSNLAPTWHETWNRLITGKRSNHQFSEAGIQLNINSPVGLVKSNSRKLKGKSLIQGSALRLAIKASSEAILNSGTMNSIRIYGGSTHGESDIILSILLNKENVRKAFWRSIIYDSIASQIKHELKHEVETPTWIYSSCTSSMHALVCAYFDILDSNSDTDSLIVGVDALSGIGVAGFSRSGASTKTKCSPFDVERDGTLVSEGAAAIILNTCKSENEDQITMMSLGMSCDAGHPTQPDPNGVGLEIAISHALNRANLKSSDIEAVVSHGTGTLLNDSAEAAALKKIFGKSMPPVTSIKGAIGHTMGAAGLFNCLVAIESCRTGWLPPTQSLSSKTISEINLVTKHAVPINRQGPVLVNCSAFGGNNVVAIFGRN